MTVYVNLKLFKYVIINKNKIKQQQNSLSNSVKTFY